jgi:signal transduction histidine kinase
LTQQSLSLSNASLRIKNDSLLLFKQKQNLYASRLDSVKKVQHIEKLTRASLLSKLEISRKNTYLIIIAALAVLSVITGYAIYRRRILKQQNLLIAEQAKQREQITKAVIDAEENERKRIGSDLHDGVGQLFSAVKMNLSGLFDRINFENNNEKFLAEKTLALVDESCKEVRIISHKMMPNALLRSGIASDIKSFIEKLDEQNLKVNFEASGFSDQLEHNEEVILYKVIQELVSNIIKHAKATELTINLINDKGSIKALVKDNGIGFDLSNMNSFEGIGLKNIKTRVDYLKGKIDFNSAPNKGTEVNIFVPLS